MYTQYCGVLCKLISAVIYEKAIISYENEVFVCEVLGIDEPFRNVTRKMKNLWINNLQNISQMTDTSC